MSTKRAGSRRSATTGTSSTGAERLESLEEKVVRMRQGLAAPDHLPLEMRGKDDPKLWAKLRAIEDRAFEESGRIRELRAQAEPTRAQAGTKQKIVAALKGKSSKKVAKAPAPKKRAKKPQK